MSLSSRQEAMLKRGVEAHERLALTAAHIRGVLAIIASRIPGGGLSAEEQALLKSSSESLKESRQSLQAAQDAAESEP